MKIINTGKMNHDDIFPCYSPLLSKYLVEIKGIEFVDIQFSEKNNKKIWIFIQSPILQLALTEWTERGKSGNKIY